VKDKEVVSGHKNAKTVKLTSLIISDASERVSKGIIAGKIDIRIAVT